MLQHICNYTADIDLNIEQYYLRTYYTFKYTFMAL